MNNETLYRAAVVLLGLISAALISFAHRPSDGVRQRRGLGLAGAALSSGTALTTASA